MADPRGSIGRLAVVLLAWAGIACDGPPAGPGTGNPVYGGVERVVRTPTPVGFPFHLPGIDADHVYADLDGGGPIVALSRTTGDVVWRYERPFGGPANVAVHRGMVLFAGTDAVALDAATGQERWRFATGGNASLGVSAASDGGFYFGTDHVVFALAAADGTLRWRTDLGEGWEHRAIVRGVSVGGDTVYANVEQYLSVNGDRAVGHVFALDRHTGDVFWQFTEGDGSDRRWFRNEPVVARNWLILSDHERNVYIAVDRRTGLAAWRTPGDPDRYFGSLDAPKVSSDTVFAASSDRRVTAMDLRTGAVLWSTRVGGSVDAIVLCGSRVLAHDMMLHVLDRATGQKLGEFHDQGSAHSALLTSKFAADGREAFVLGTRFVYGFRCPG